MKLQSLIIIASLTPLISMACGPSPQRVTKEVLIHAPISEVWALVSNIGAMNQWHSEVNTSQLEEKSSNQGKPEQYRILGLKHGGSIIQKQRETQTSEMKIGFTIEQGEMPVSNYSDVISVKPGLAADETIVTWIGRFSNKANSMQAPLGADDASAIAAVAHWYEVGLRGLKEHFEKRNISFMY